MPKVEIPCGDHGVSEALFTLSIALDMEGGNTHGSSGWPHAIKHICAEGGTYNQILLVPLCVRQYFAQGNVGQ